MHTIRWLSLISALTLVGCGQKADTPDAGTTPEGGQSGKVPPKPTGPQPDAEIASLVNGMGDGALAVLMVRPDLWSGVHKGLATVAGGFGASAQAGLGMIESFEGALAVFSGEIPAMPGKMPGVDESRPLAMSVGEPLLDGPPGLAAVHPEGAPLPGLRHQLSVPVKAGGELLEAWSAHLDTVGKKAPLAGVEGATAWRLSGGNWAALIPEGDRLRGVLLTNLMPSPEVSEGAPAALRPPAKGDNPATSAFLGFSKARAPLSIYVRAWQIAPLTAYQGMLSARGALEGNDLPESTRRLVMDKARSLLLLAESLTGDEAATFEDHALIVHPGDAGLTLQSLSSLTDAGRKALEAGRKSGAGLPALKPGAKPAVDALMAVGLGELLGATPAVWPWSTYQDADKLTAALRECGTACSMYAALRAPLPVAKALVRLSEARTVLSSLQGARVVMMDGGAQRNSLAEALVLSGAVDGEAAKAEIARLADGKPEAVTAGAHVVLSYGVDGGEPGAVFAGGEPATAPKGAQGFGPKETLAQVTIDGGALLKMVFGALLGGGSGQLAPLRWTLAHQGPVLEGRLSLSVTGSAAPEPPLDAELREARWAAQLRGPKVEGEACLYKALQLTSVALGGVSDASPGSTAEGQALTQTAQAIAPQLRCARKGAASAPVIEGLERIYAEAFDRWARHSWEFGQGEAWLHQLCADEGPACEARDALKALPRITHTEGEVMCPSEALPRAHGEPRRLIGRLAWIKGALLLDEAPVEMKDLEVRLTARAGGEPGRIDLAVEGEAKVEDVSPVLKAARSAGADEMHIIVRDSEGDVGRVALSMALKKVPRTTGFQLTMDGSGYEVTGMGRKRRVSVPAGATVDDMRVALRGAGEPAPVFLYAAPDTPWAWVASTSAALCPNIALVESPRKGGGGGGSTAYRPTSTPTETTLDDDPPSEAQVGNARKAQASFRSYVPRIKACYERALKSAGPGFSGRLVLEVSIDADGKVESAKAKGMNDLHRCVLGVARRAKFPKGAGPITLKMPFIFTPQ